MVAAKPLAAAAMAAAVTPAVAVDVLPLRLLCHLPIRKLRLPKRLRFRPLQLPILLLGSPSLARWLVLASFAKQGRQAQLSNNAKRD